jgi:hypothetical protein
MPHSEDFMARAGQRQAASGGPPPGCDPPDDLAGRMASAGAAGATAATPGVPAVAHFERALALCRDHGNRYTEAGILTHVGDARHLAGQLRQARRAWQQALAIYEDIHPANAGQVRAKLARTED